jgi:acetylornithine deacetylase/succinyl-diaminopimelate desuccinylase-like protein
MTERAQGNRAGAIQRAELHYDSGQFLAVLARRVAVPNESHNPAAAPYQRVYLAEQIAPAAEALGCRWWIDDNPVPAGNPFLVAERIEDPARPTVLVYGHGDTVGAQEGQWHEGLSPWKLSQVGERIYGRGTADNKGQHSINLAALEQVLAERGGRLGFNLKLLIETGEEIGSRGLREYAALNRERLAATVLIASDGPRLKPERATIYLGSRGVMNMILELNLRAGAHHSGNWGGVLANPGTILANAIASIVDRNGRMALPELRPPPMSNAVRQALADCEMDGGPDAPAIDRDWGEPGLTPWERLFGFNTFEVLAFRTGDVDKPQNAIPEKASAVCQIRFVPGSDEAKFLPAIRRHLDANGYGNITLEQSRGLMRATRTEPDHPWVKWAAASIERTLGAKPAVLPNLGGTIPNDVFTEILAMPTIWVPHSYSACSQHAPNEHMLAPIVREGLQMMTGIFWDLGEAGTPAYTNGHECRLMGRANVLPSPSPPPAREGGITG